MKNKPSKKLSRLTVKKTGNTLFYLSRACLKFRKMRVAATYEGRVVVYCEHCLMNHQNVLNLNRRGAPRISLIIQAIDVERSLAFELIADTTKRVCFIQYRDTHEDGPEGALRTDTLADHALAIEEVHSYFRLKDKLRRRGI